MNALHLVSAAPAVAAELEKAPAAEDTVAGWTAFVIFLFLIAAVAVIGYFVTRSLKIAGRAKDQGVYGDEPVDHTGEQPHDSK